MGLSATEVDLEGCNMGQCPLLKLGATAVVGAVIALPHRSVVCEKVCVLVCH